MIFKRIRNKKILFIGSLVMASLLYAQGSQPVEIIEPEQTEQTPVKNLKQRIYQIL